MRIYKSIFTAALTAILALTVTAHGQSGEGLLEDHRPFDYSDKYYEDNGVFGHEVIGRRTGVDTFSVFDSNSDLRFRGVRILETRTAYDHEGKPLYWAFYGDLERSSFTFDKAGEQAMEAARSTSVYFFPSTKIAGAQRQSALIDRRENNPEKNPLGIGAAVEVAYTRKVLTKEGRVIMNDILGRNGKSLDGLPVIKTISQLNELVRYELVTLTARDIAIQNGAPYVIANVIEEPRFGAIAPDAYLNFTGNGDKPIDAESQFFEQFECLKKTGGFCEQ
ncbi:MAG: hypothetical protein DWQ47_08055 [Acidobacteria bacterium]|nr:MAG: hypothetical protein DWQ32_16155 [Acidobacteriota bacterium]REJ99134.1 MAG: hypothetical protein DWQ38_13820 [Acidobacteriota bacterium]REK16145.1 MAG: hypothetical protein DWQ43_03865 [Acidobacteriota bacterium]REK43826.1 MAG: hypothetical protein DWQ47_08055 [Acidobacteriota bacterium]